MELYEIKQNKPKLLGRVKDEIINSKAFRVKYFESHFYSFALYYFSHFFTYKSAGFHKDWAKEMKSWKNCFIVWFRESWKTIWLMAYIIWSIAYNKKSFILYYSYEQTLSSSRLFDIIVQLKTNYKLINDYWELFPWKNTKEDWLEKKSVQEFITTNKIKIKAMSMGMTSRGMLHTSWSEAKRPDFLILDDIDVLDSVRNPEVIDKNYQFLKWEVFGWLDSECQTIFLWNVISNDWIVPRHKRDIEDSSRYISEMPVIKNGEITWDRFVHTTQEMFEAREQWLKKISLELKREEQKEDFEPNFLLIPNISVWNPVFNQDKVSSIELLKWVKDDKFKDLIIFKKPENNLYWWVDTALWGKDGDYSTIIIRNSKLELMVSFKAKVEPDILDEIINHIVCLWYKGLIGIESNNTWIATITKAKQRPRKWLLYVERQIDKVTARPMAKYWFNTNVKSKHLIIENLKEAIVNESLIWFDERELDDFMNYYYDQKLACNALKWKHDDMVIAEAICLQMSKQPKKLVFA